MKIDKKALDMISSLPDEQFIAMLRLVTGNAGISLKAKSFTHEDAERLRSTLRSLSESDVDRAMEIYEHYKNGG